MVTIVADTNSLVLFLGSCDPEEFPRKDKAFMIWSEAELTLFYISILKLPDKQVEFYHQRILLVMR